jgi:hypothetical protein
MTTNNPLNVNLSGATGSGNFVGANTPTLITPVLGVATATSVNFGGSDLKSYTNTAVITPTLLFGGLSTGITYSVNTGIRTKVGGNVIFCIFIQLTNKGSATGSATIATGLPNAPQSTISLAQFPVSMFENLTYAVGIPCCSFPNPGVATLTLFTQKTGTTVTIMDNTFFNNNSNIYITGIFTAQN